jgi:hypothetical protein
MADRPDPVEWFDLDPQAATALADAIAAADTDATLSAWRGDYGEAMAAALGRPSEQAAPARLMSAALPAADTAIRQQLPLVGLSDVLGPALEFMQRRAITADVVRASLTDVGRTERKNRAWFGRPGLDAELAVWLNRHLYGAIYQLGRLQFERLAVGDAEVVLSLHIPAGMGPMSPRSVDESLDLARAFFRRHFPDERPRRAICVSWLLDPQLAEYLPETSNIISFQRRFALDPADPGDGGGSEAVRRFVFGEALTPLSEQPSASTLERAIHAHVGAGGRFLARRGWFEL